MPFAIKAAQPNIQNPTIQAAYFQKYDYVEMQNGFGLNK